MRKVTTISLNGNALQIDEEGYEVLRGWLEQADRNLASNPDRAEILADLEQAVADKCRASLGSHKTVVSEVEIRRILIEMGSVEPAQDPATGHSPGAGGGAAAAAGSGPGAASPGVSPAQRRLYRLDEHSMWAGVCTGLAAYFGLDVIWMRLIFILLTLFTGVWLLVYIAMIFIVPRARTPAEIAAARGETFSAQDLVDRLKKKA